MDNFRALSGSRASTEPCSTVSAASGFDPAHEVRDTLTRNQEQRWSHLIQFAETLKEVQQ